MLLGEMFSSELVTRHLLKLYGDNQSNLPLPSSTVTEK